MDSSHCNNYICKTLIRSAENGRINIKGDRNHRIAMSLSLLKLLGDSIAKTSWSVHTKQVFWTVCTVAFFGSFRMGELLSSFQNSFDKCSTLLWSDVKQYKNSWLFHVKTPKSRNNGGEFVNIFTFSGHNCCPFRAMCKLAKLSKNAIEKNQPFLALRMANY